MSAVTNPVAQWPESPSAGVASALTSLVPWKTTAGYWVFLPKGSTPPTGATQGAVVASGSYNTLLTSTTIGKRLTKRTDRFVLTY